MPSDTPNHSYNRPDKGSTDWDVPLNANFADLDTDVAIWDDDANKGNYTPANGAHFIANDTGDVYRGDGSSWNSIGSISGSGGGGSAVDVQENGTTVVSGAAAIDFGTDLQAELKTGTSDTARVDFTGSGAGSGTYYEKVSAWGDVQNAIDSANSAGGGTVLIEAGTYGPLDNGDAVTMKSNVTLMGEGPGITHIVYEGDSDSLINDTNNAQNDMHLRDLSIDGNGIGDAGAHWGYGNADQDFNRRCYMENVHVSQCANGGIGFRNVQDGAFRRCVIEECGKVSINAAQTCKGVMITDCFINNPTTWPNSTSGFLHGTSVEHSSECVVDSVVVKNGGASPAFNMNTCDNCVLSNSVAQGVDWGVESVRDAHSNVYVGNVFKDITELGMHMQTYTADASNPDRIVRYNIVHGNTFSNIGGPALNAEYGFSFHFTGNWINGFGSNSSTDSQDAIAGYNSPVLVAEGMISDNIIQGNDGGGAAISIDAPSTSTFLQVQNNYCEGDVSVGTDGAFAQGNDVNGDLTLSGSGTAALANRVSGSISATDTSANL